MENFEKELSAEIETGRPSITTLIAYNSTSESAWFYLTLGKQDGWVSDVKTVFERYAKKWDVWYNPATSLQGAIQIPPRKWLVYAPPQNLGFNGNFAINTAPMACPNKDFPNGNNTGEFYLNVQDIGGWEDINISCVNGVNSQLQYWMFWGTGKWSVNNLPPYINNFSNMPLGKNSGISGVYPTGCSTCTGGVSPCPNPLPSDQPNQTDICNIYRSGRGGYVVLSYLGAI